jgi:hypothetical protein
MSYRTHSTQGRLSPLQSSYCTGQLYCRALYCRPVVLQGFVLQASCTAGLCTAGQLYRRALKCKGSTPVFKDHMQGSKVYQAVSPHVRCMLLQRPPAALLRLQPLSPPAADHQMLLRLLQASTTLRQDASVRACCSEPVAEKGVGEGPCCTPASTNTPHQQQPRST